MKAKRREVDWTKISKAKTALQLIRVLERLFKNEGDVDGSRLHNS